jgi:hypothetical protein
MSEMKALSSEDLEALLQDDPGDEAFVELASRLSASPEDRQRARDICFRGLSRNSHNLRGRLLLARLFYIDEMFPFCVRELQELRRSADTPSLRRLLESFGEALEEAKRDEHAEAVVGELDLDSDFVDALEELETEDK